MIYLRKLKKVGNKSNKILIYITFTLANNSKTNNWGYYGSTKEKNITVKKKYEKIS